MSIIIVAKPKVTRPLLEHVLVFGMHVYRLTKTLLSCIANMEPSLVFFMFFFLDAFQNLLCVSQFFFLIAVPEDFSFNNLMITFTPLHFQLPYCFFVNISDDFVLESTEIFHLHLQTNDPYVNFKTSNLSVEIQDNDRKTNNLTNYILSTRSHYLTLRLI